MYRKSKRWLVVVLGLVLVVVTACAPAATPTATPQPTVPPEKPTATPVSATPAEEIERGGTLSLVVTTQLRTLSPLKTTSITHNMGFNIFYEPLLKPKELLRGEGFAPVLAKSWEVAEDRLSITFHLREGVTFHDGTPFNAEAVKYNFEYRMDPDNAAVTMTDFDRVKSIEVVDDYTVVVHLSAPDPAFLGVIGYPNDAMISPKAIEKYGDELGLHPVGTGPFVLEKYEPGGELIAVRNENYWDPTYPYLDRIEVTGILESAVRMMALESGDVDVVNIVLWNDAPELKEEGILFSIAPPGLSTSLIQNNKKAPTDELAVRKAIAYAVDREAILEVAYNGIGLPNLTGLNPKSWGYCQEAADMAYTYNPEKAKSVLDEAGWVDSDGDGIRDRDGEPLVIDFIVPPWDADPLLGEIVMEQLRDIGIDCKAETTETQVLFSRLLEGDYSMSHWGEMPRTLDPHESFHNFHSESPGNRFQYENPEVDAMLEKAASLLDREERAKIYCDIQKKLLEDVATVWCIHEAYYAFGYRANVHGFTQPYYRVPDFRLIWKSSE